MLNKQCLASPPATMCVFHFSIGLQANNLSEQKLIFESSKAVSVISTFDDLGLKVDPLEAYMLTVRCAH